MALVRATSGSSGGGGGTKVQVGSFTAVNGNNTVSLDFLPSKLYVYKNRLMYTDSESGILTATYDKDLSTNKQYRFRKQNGICYSEALVFPNANSNSDCIRSISATNFVINTSASVNFTGDYTFIATE